MKNIYFLFFGILISFFSTAQVTSVSSGAWNSGSTWSTGTVPTSSSQVMINSGHTITVNAAAVAGRITVNAGGTLSASSGTLAVTDSVVNAGSFSASGTSITINGTGTTGFTNTGTLAVSGGMLTVGPAGGGNRVVRNISNGTINVSSGTLNINGEFYHSAPCNFYQTGGFIIVDGNAGGNLANSVPAGNSLVHLTFATYTDGGVISLTGGQLKIVDPHPAGSLALHYASYGQGQRELGKDHSFIFGDISSTDPGTAVGFQVDLANTENLAIGSMVVEGSPANNRFVTMKDDPIVIAGSLILNYGSEFRPGHDVYLAGNLNINMGSTLTVPGLWFTKKNLVSGDIFTVTTAQSVNIDGIIRNSATAPTASVNTLMNNNTTGLSISGEHIHVASQLTLQYNTLLDMNGLMLTLGTSPASPGSMFANGSFSPNMPRVRNARIKRFIGTTPAVYDFPLGSTGFTPARKLVSLDFVQAPATGGSITVEWVNTNGGDNGLPLQEGSITVDTTLLGYWKITPGDGLAGGMYHGTFQPMLITDVPNYTKTVLLKRNNSTSPWTLHGTHNTTSSYNNNHLTLYRTNMTQYGEFGIGYSNSADNSATTVAPGNWHNPAIWSTGFVPNSNTAVIIAGGHEVNVNVSGNYQAKSVTINSGGVLRVQTTALFVTDSVMNNGVLFMQGGELNITGVRGAGLTNNALIEMTGGYLRVGGNGGYKDRSFTNRGTFTISNGIAEVNGNFSNTINAQFVQSGGDIIVSTSAALAANSLPAGTKTVEFLNPSNKITFSGGTFTITDPHPQNEHTLFFNDPGATIVTSPSHTFRFGDAMGSAPSGGHVNGYYITMGGTHSGLHLGNLVVDGPDAFNRHVSWDIPVTIQGNLTVNGGELKPLTSTTLKGHFTVNTGGIATFEEALILSGTSVQNIVKPGVVRSGPTAHGHFSTLIISNSGGGIHAFADIGVHQFISFTNGGFINMNGNTLILGSPAGTSGSIGNVQGYVIGKFKHYVIPSPGGYTFPLGLSTGRKYASIDFYTAAPTTFGSVTAEWVPAYGGTNGLPLTEGSLVVDSTSRAGYWRISSGDGLTGGVYKASLFAQGIDGISDVSKVVMLKRSDAAAPWTLSGTHVTTTGNPTTGMMLSRENLSGFSDFGIGISSGNTSNTVTSVTSGSWNAGSTWNTGTVPSGSSQVVIDNGHSVTVNDASVAATLTINAGGTLNAVSNVLTVTDSMVNAGTINITGASISIEGAATTGLTNTGNIQLSSGTLTIGGNGAHNRSFINQHIFGISGGVLNVNGNFSNTATAQFTQTGGNINIDGNAAGNAANSVATGTHIVEFLNPSNKIMLTGGTFTIADPHVSSSFTTYTLYFYNTAMAAVSASVNHTFRFGNGVSTDAGGNAKGFHIYLYSTNIAFHPGNIVIEGPAGTNRHVSPEYTMTIKGDLTVNNGGEYRQLSATIFEGDLTVNTGGIATMRDITEFKSTTSSQQIIAAGTIRNDISAPDGNFSTLIISNTGGSVNFNSDIQVSDFLTFMNGGNIHMNGHTLTLGVSATQRGSLGNVQGYVNGKFRNYVTAANGSYTFPIGIASGRKYANISFNPAPSTGGSLTAEWIPVYGGTSGLPVTEGSMVVDSTSRSGYWRIVAGDGLTGGTYQATLSAVAVDGISDASKVVMLKRDNAAAPWTLNGTHVTTTGSSSSALLVREGMSGFSEFGIGIASGNTPLPVTLVSFTGTLINKTMVKLDWSVAQQQGIDRYEIERSTNGRDFSVIGTVSANSLSNFHYSFTDERPARGRNYYRLKIGEAGRTSYSKVLDLSTGSKESIYVYPIPARNMITAERNSSEITEGIITDMQGKVMMQVRLTQEKQQVDIGLLPPGMYILRAGEHSVTIIKQ